MAGQNFVLKNSEQVRNSITSDELKRIKTMYQDLYRDISRQVSRLGKNDIKKQNLVLLKRDIEGRIKQLNKDIETNIVRDMKTVTNQVVEDTREFLKKCGFKEEDIKDAFLYVPEQVVRSIITGNVYQEGWSLSGAIWGYNKKTQDSLDEIISIGVQQNKSAYDIAKDLEMYVNPSSKKPSRTIQSWRYDKNGNKVVDKFRFGKVDYNAQRLARTMISHAYQQSFEAVNKNDPFITGYRWLTSNFHGRVCEICRDRAETNKYGLGVGVFPKDKLPLDHPNGMCTFEAVMEESLDDIAKRIGKWYQAPLGTYPEIDAYARDFIG